MGAVRARLPLVHERRNMRSHTRRPAPSTGRPEFISSRTSQSASGMSKAWAFQAR